MRSGSEKPKPECMYMYIMPFIPKKMFSTVSRLYPRDKITVWLRDSLK